jgi:hypothetical protein
MDDLAIGRRQRFAAIALIGALMQAVATLAEPDFRTATWSLVPISLFAFPVILVVSVIVIRRGVPRLIQLLAITTIIAAVSAAILILLVTVDPASPFATFRSWWVGLLAVYTFGLMTAPWASWRRGAWV